MAYEQDINTPIRYFIGLVSNLYQAPWSTVNGAELSVPAMEADGVPDQRFAFSHRFNAGDVDDLNTRGAEFGMSVVDSMPGDWRYSA